jgi:AHBA synthesis associated protein
MAGKRTGRVPGHRGGAAMDGVRAVVFDMDGVLVDSFTAWARTVDRTAREFGHGGVSKERFRDLFGQSTSRDVELLMPSAKVADVETAYERNFALYLEEVRVMPGAGEMLEALKGKGIALAVATNTPAQLAGRILGDVDLLRHLDALTGGDEVDRPKPAPEILETAMGKLNVSARHTVYVGDTEYDVQTGRAAGVFTVGFRIDGDGRIEKLEELPALVKGISD